MVVGAFPIAKLAVLLVKQISKPIANVCKERAKNSPFFRTYVCMPPAQFYNWCEVKAKMWILNLGKPVNIPVLSQEMAIELGANLLGETVIFVIGSGLLIVEYNRQSKKETAKELKKEEEMKHITTTITDLYFAVQQQQTQLREMERLVHSITGTKPVSPPQGPTPPPAATPTVPPQSPPTIGPKVNNIHYVHHYNTDNNQSQVSQTPYPDRGFILKSLNYIEMDVLSSTFFAESNNKKSQDMDVKVNKSKSQTKLLPPQELHQKEALLTETLHNLENEFRSLF